MTLKAWSHAFWVGSPHLPEIGWIPNRCSRPANKCIPVCAAVRTEKVWSSSYAKAKIITSVARWEEFWVKLTCKSYPSINSSNGCWGAECSNPSNCILPLHSQRLLIHQSDSGSNHWPQYLILKQITKFLHHEFKIYINQRKCLEQNPRYMNPRPLLYKLQITLSLPPLLLKWINLGTNGILI